MLRVRSKVAFEGHRQSRTKVAKDPDQLIAGKATRDMTPAPKVGAPLRLPAPRLNVGALLQSWITCCTRLHFGTINERGRIRWSRHPTSSAVGISMSTGRSQLPRRVRCQVRYEHLYSANKTVRGSEARNLWSAQEGQGTSLLPCIVLTTHAARSLSSPTTPRTLYRPSSLLSNRLQRVLHYSSVVMAGITTKQLYNTSPRSPLETRLRS